MNAREAGEFHGLRDCQFFGKIHVLPSVKHLFILASLRIVKGKIYALHHTSIIRYSNVMETPVETVGCRKSFVINKTFSTGLQVIRVLHVFPKRLGHILIQVVLYNVSIPTHP